MSRRKGLPAAAKRKDPVDNASATASAPISVGQELLRLLWGGDLTRGRVEGPCGLVLAVVVCARA
eukprot:11108510-Prorocentrum_lima.AAC.1